MFPLDPSKPSKMRQPPAHCHSPGTCEIHFILSFIDSHKFDIFFLEHAVNYNEISSRLHEDTASNSMERTEEEPKFLDTINPLLSFSKADLAAMDQEYDQFFDESDSSSDDNEPVDLGETDF